MQAAEPIASQQITPCCAERICRLVQWAPFKNNPSLIGRATIAFAGGWIVVGIPIFRSKDGLSVGVPAFPIQRNSMPKVASRSATAKSNTPRLSHSKPPRRVSARAGWCWPHSPRRESAHERPGRPVDPSHCWRIVGDQTVYLAARGASLAQIDVPKVSLLMRYRSYCRHVFRMSGASGNYHRPPDLSVVFLKFIFSTG